MKKLVLFLFMAATLTSCLKVRECHCTYDVPGGTGEANIDVVGNNSIAKQQCNDQKKELEQVNGNTNVNCNLK